MTDKEIFEKLFSIYNLSDDDKGVVSACLVRDGKIIECSVSMKDGIHAEYALLQKLKQRNFHIKQEDMVYTTVEPCGKRMLESMGEKMGDCTSNLIEGGVKHIVYAASDSDASSSTRYKFKSAGVIFTQVGNQEIIKKSIDVFNSTCKKRNHWLPLK